MCFSQAKHLLVTLLPLSGIFLDAAASAQYLDFEQIDSVMRPGMLVLSDLNGDGCDEILTSQANHVYLYVWDEDHLSLKSQLAQDRSWSLIGVAAADVVGDSRREITAILASSGFLKIQIYQMEEDCYPSLMEEECRPVRSDSIVVSRAVLGGQLSSRGPYDWDIGAAVLGRLAVGSAKSPMILTFSTGFSKWPRGVGAFDPNPPHNMLWQYRIGPRVVEPTSVFRHATPESTCILLRGAYAGQNVCDSGLCDSVSVVMAVNAKGRPLWNKRVGGKGTEPFVSLSDLDADGTPEVVVACAETGKGAGSPSQVMVVSLFDGEVRKSIEIGTSATGLTTSDMYGDGRPEVILIGRNGGLFLYDSELNRRGLTYGVSAPWGLVAGDVDFDGDPEIFVSAETGTSVDVYDRSLEHIGRVPTECSPVKTLRIMSLSRKRRVLAIGTEQSIILYAASAAGAAPWIEPAVARGGNPTLWLAGGLLGGLILGGLVWGGGRVLLSVRPVGPVKSLVSELSIVRHGTRTDGKSEEPLVRLRRGLKSCAQPDGAELGRLILKESCGVYGSYVAPTLTRIVKLSAVGGPVSLTLPLAMAAFQADRLLKHVLGQLRDAEGRDAIKTHLRRGGPSSGTRGGAHDDAYVGTPSGEGGTQGDEGRQAGGQPSGAPSTDPGRRTLKDRDFTAACAAAARSLERLDALLQRLNRAALSRLRADPYVETSAAAAALQERFDRTGVELGGIEVSGRVGVRVFIEPEALRRSVCDVLSNAIEACHETANPRVSVHIVGGERKVILQVIDNGRGLPRKDWETVFHGKSLKEPRGGAGLSRARQAIESCSGRISVRESVPWERTVIEIELCRAASS